MEKIKTTVEQLQTTLGEYDARLAVMKAESLEVRADTKGEYIRQVTRLKSERDNFVLQYGQIHLGDDLREGTKEAWDVFATSFEKVVSTYKGST